jgi:hypothetical protein
MARFRTIKPEFFADEKLGDCSRDARLLFVGLWCFCDDAGRKEYSPRRIRREIFPGDNDLTTSKIEALLAELERVDIIWTYEVDEEQYLWIPNFVRHQRIDRPSHSDIPPHPDDPDPDCLCLGCQRRRDPEAKPTYTHQTSNGRRRHKPKRNHRKASVPVSTRRVLVEDSSNTLVEPIRGALDEEARLSKSKSKSSNTEQLSYIHTGLTAEFEAIQTGAETPEAQENRQTQSAALDALARGILAQLNITSNSNIINTLTKSIQVRAKSRSCTIESSAAQILPRAAGVLSRAQPESWEAWFFDSRYDYVNAGDPRLSDRHSWVRCTCGGTRCEDGWEAITIDGKRVARRCPDCVKLWEE